MCPSRTWHMSALIRVNGDEAPVAFSNRGRACGRVYDPCCSPRCSPYLCPGPCRECGRGRRRSARSGSMRWMLRGTGSRRHGRVSCPGLCHSPCRSRRRDRVSCPDSLSQSLSQSPSRSTITGLVGHGLGVGCGQPVEGQCGPRRTSRRSAPAAVPGKRSEGSVLS